MESRQIPESLLDIVVAGKDKAPANETLAKDRDRVHAGFVGLSRSFSKDFPAIDDMPLLQVDFGVIVARLGDMLDQIEALRDWIDLKALEEDFRENGNLMGFLQICYPGHRPFPLATFRTPFDYHCCRRG